MSKQKHSTISFRVDNDSACVFSSILQQGFMFPAFVGCSIKSLLCHQFGVTPEYLSGRIKTIFLNGKPVDDVETTIITDGAVLALSAAMPGLVGATFRTGGALSVFRSSITHRNETGKSKVSAEGMVTLKLFNLLVSEMGPDFLEKGIWVKSGILKNFIEEKKTAWQAAFKSVIIDGQKIKPDELRFLNWNDSQKLVFVTVQIG
ncbi:MAG: hypothetical protein ACQETR_09225 [Thermodesulfobacteriota bacterium]